MAERVPGPLTPPDLLAAASDVFIANGAKGRAALREMRQRAVAHVREGLRRRLEAPLPGKTPEPPRPGVAATPRLEPDWPLEIRLQNGRKVRATFTPAVARRS